MRRINILWSAVLAMTLGIALLLSPGAARAQFQTEVQPELSKDWTVRVGLFIPQSQATRSKTGEVGFSGHVERRVYDGIHYAVTVGIGYNGMDDVYNVPIMANLIASQHNLRYGFGVGYSFGKRLDGRGMSGVALGLILGYQLTHTTNPLSLDLRYYFISGANNELDGYSLSLGIRF